VDPLILNIFENSSDIVNILKKNRCGISNKVVMINGKIEIIASLIALFLKYVIHSFKPIAAIKTKQAGGKELKSSHKRNVMDKQ
jgi:hypothetical protein